MLQTLSTPDLAEQLGGPSLVVLDVRPMAAINGWPLRGEARGGHIPGAIPFPLVWAEKSEPADLKFHLQSKGVTADRMVVVYGYARDEGAALASRLVELGYANVRVYGAGLAEWADEGRPMSRLPRYHKLVHPDWVQRLMNGQEPETYTAGKFAVFHVNFGVPEDYRRGHIPGASHLDTLALESPEDWNRRLPDELEAALRAHGLTHDTTVVVYGRHADPDSRDPHPGQSAGQIAATRAAAILMYAGVEDVRLLDGGLNAWVAAGYPVETEEHVPTPTAEFGVTIPNHPDYMVDLQEAKQLLRDPNGVLVSIRSWKEFIGETSGYHYIGPRGRIAGAVWGNCGSDAYHMENYRNADNTMRNFEEIETNWREVGITPDKRVAFYCGTGWRASETFFYAHVMGWERVAVYDGGWFEWIRDPANPVDTGLPLSAVSGG
jgi:3-mercaptopyruvate sulfurtransferase SseA